MSVLYSVRGFKWSACEEFGWGLEEAKRIRLVFIDDDILSETQKFEGLNRSWLLLKPLQHVTVSDVASYLLHAFHLHQSCPHGLLLSMSGFVLPSFESTSLLNDNEIIRVRKKREILSLEGNDTANAVEELRAVEKQPVPNGILLLASKEFEKEKGGYESDDPELESDGENNNVLEDIEGSSGRNDDPRNRKRKASEKLCGSRKKQLAKTDYDAKDEKSSEESPAPLDKGDLLMAAMKRTDEVQQNDKAIEDAKTASKKAKKNKMSSQTM